MDMDFRKNIRPSAIIVLLLLSAFVMGLWRLSCSNNRPSICKTHGDHGSAPPEAEPQPSSLEDNHTSPIFKLDYGQWTKGNGATLIIEDSTPSPSWVFRIEVTDDESSPRNAYLVMANLDSDPDMEFFVHQPNVPRAIQRASSSSADSTTNIVPGTFIVDYCGRSISRSTLW
jgi:hypothetical protein